MKAVIGTYMWQLLLTEILVLWHIHYVFSSFYCLMNDYTSDSCHLLIYGVGVEIATDILCESDLCHCKLPVSR